MEKKDKNNEHKQVEQIEDELPSYEESVEDKNNEEQEQDKAPYVKFPHPINKHTAKRSSNKEFPGNQTLTYMKKKWFMNINVQINEK